MPAVSSIIAAVGVGASVAGTGLAVAGSQKQSAAAKSKAVIDGRVSALQEQGVGIRQSYESSIAGTQKGLLDLTSQQSLNNINLQRGVIGLQAQSEDVRREMNRVLQGGNATRQTGAQALEGLAQGNDVLNRTNDQLTRNIYSLERQKDDFTRAQDVNNRASDVLDRQVEDIQSRVAAIQSQRAQREVVRQGVVAQATGLAQEVSKGQSLGDSGVTAARQTVQNRVALANSRTEQDKRISDIMRGIASGKRELGVGNRELGVQSREVGVLQRGVQEQQYELGTQSRELGVQARGINFGLNQDQYRIQDAQYQSNDSIFGLNSQISSLYLGAQDTNAGLVGQANTLNSTLIDQNAGLTSEMNNIQKSIFALGGDSSQAAQAAAGGSSLAGLGLGLTSLGGSVASFGKTDLAKYLTSPTSTTPALTDQPQVQSGYPSWMANATYGVG